MAMDPTIQVAAVFAGVNVALLLVLTAIWIRNYRTFRTGLTLGLLAFGGVLLVENVLAIYFFFSTAMLYSGSAAAQQAVLVLRTLQMVALLFLTYVTWR